MTFFGPGPGDLQNWTLPVWGVVFDRLASGNVEGHSVTIGGGRTLTDKTAKQQIEWATKLNLPALNQNTIDAILNRFVGFSLGVRYMEESKVHVIHQLVKRGAPLQRKVQTWLDKDKTKEMFKDMIRSYDSFAAAKADLVNVKKWPRENDGHPFKTNPAYDAAVKCAHCLKFLVEEEFVTINGYDLSGRNWLEAGFNGNNRELLAICATNMDPHDMIKPRDIRDTTGTGNHILLSLAGHNAFEAFEIALDRMTRSGLLGYKELKQIFHPAAMHEICAVAPPSVAAALYAKGINIGNVEHQHHPVSGQLEGSWHMAAAFNPMALDFVKWLKKWSSLSADNRNQDNETPLMYAACFDQPGAIAWLCEHSDPTLPRLPGGHPGWALLCAAKSSYFNSSEIFSIILQHMPKKFFNGEYGKICGTEIAAGLVRHKEKLRNGDVDEPSQTGMERLQVYKMQALVRRLPNHWPGSVWHLALEAYAVDNGVGALKHSMATEVRRTRSTSTRRRRGPNTTRLGLEPSDDEYDDDVAELSSRAGSSAVGGRRGNAPERKALGSIRSRSGQRSTALGRTRDSSSMVTKSVRRRQTGNMRD